MYAKRYFSTMHLGGWSADGRFVYAKRYLGPGWHIELRVRVSIRFPKLRVGFPLSCSLPRAHSDQTPPRPEFGGWPFRLRETAFCASNRAAARARCISGPRKWPRCPARCVFVMTSAPWVPRRRPGCPGCAHVAPRCAQDAPSRRPDGPRMRPVDAQDAQEMRPKAANSGSCSVMGRCAMGMLSFGFVSLSGSRSSA